MTTVPNGTSINGTISEKRGDRCEPAPLGAPRYGSTKGLFFYFLRNPSGTRDKIILTNHRGDEHSACIQHNTPIVAQFRLELHLKLNIVWPSKVPTGPRNLLSLVQYITQHTVGFQWSPAIIPLESPNTKRSSGSL